MYAVRTLKRQQCEAFTLSARISAAHFPGSEIFSITHQVMESTLLCLYFAIL